MSLFPKPLCTVFPLTDTLRWRPPSRFPRQGAPKRERLCLIVSRDAAYILHSSTRPGNVNATIEPGGGKPAPSRRSARASNRRWDISTTPVTRSRRLGVHIFSTSRHRDCRAAYPKLFPTTPLKLTEKKKDPRYGQRHAGNNKPSIMVNYPDPVVFDHSITRGRCAHGTRQTET